jgi:hypothetical protein
VDHPSLYRAKAISVGPGSIEAFVPQVFGETSITITESMGSLPLGPMMGWVFFQAGNCEFPVWAGEGSGGGGGGADEVWIGNDAPTDAFKELWYDPDAPAPGSDEIWIGPDDPDAIATGFEIWYDTDAVPIDRTGSIIAWKQGTQAGIPLTTTDTTIYTISAPLTAGRQYEMKVTCRALNSTQYVNFTLSCAPVIAGFVMDVYAYTPTTYAFLNWDAIIRPTVTQTYAITIRARTGSGAGAVWTDGGGGIWITDKGAAIAPSP